MRVMFMTALYLPHMGGLEVLAGELLAEFQARGHNVALLTSKGERDLSEYETLDGIPVRRVDSHRVIQARDGAAILRMQREIWEYVRDFKPDVIHSHDGAVALWLYLRLTRNRAHAPVVLTLHNVMSRQYAGNEQGLPGLTTLMRLADHVTGVSEDVVSDAIRIMPEVEEKITLIRNGVAAPGLASTPVAVDGPARFLAIGRLVTQKGFDRAITAIAQLVPRHPDLRLTIVGVGELRRELEAQARGLGVADNVEFAGTVAHDDIPALMRDSIALLMPSRFEGLPLVALEAGWMARGVVGTVAPGLSLAVRDGDNGLLVDPDDPDALAAAMESLILDRELADRLGVAARRRAEAEWSLAACADGYDALYRDLRARRPGAQ